MTRAVNDATLQKAGDIYQYLIALRDCFELNDGDTLQIETNGDVSIINDVGGRFQREVKHHFGNIIRNQGYFQRGVIHNIVDETDFKWKVGEEKNEHK